MNRCLLIMLTLVAPLVMALPPERDYWITPDSLGLSYVQKEVVTPDGAHLLSWMMLTKAEKSLRTTLIITYATTGNMANMLYYANAFLKAGFDVVLFDYRGFGHSADFLKDPAYLYYNEYVTDTKTAIDAARKQFPINKVGIVSSSASTILTTLAVQTEPVDFIIGEGYTRDPQRIVDIWKKKAPYFKIILPMGADKYVEATRKITCPMLLMTVRKMMSRPLPMFVLLPPCDPTANFFCTTGTTWRLLLYGRRKSLPMVMFGASGSLLYQSDRLLSKLSDLPGPRSILLFLS